jgi:hypothetical protein
MQAPFIAKPNKFQSVTARKPLKCQRKLISVSHFTGYAKGHTKFSETMHREVYCRLRRIWTCHFRGWQIYEETQFPPHPTLSAEPVFHFRSPGIDYQPGGQVRQPYLSYRPARLHRRNRFLGCLNVYKYGL